MTAVAEPGLEVGKARVRKEDARLITGRTRWTDNIVKAVLYAADHGGAGDPAEAPAEAQHEGASA